MRVIILLNFNYFTTIYITKKSNESDFSLLENFFPNNINLCNINQTFKFALQKLINLFSLIKYYNERIVCNVTSRPMGHPALWTTFSTIGNFKHYLRVAIIIQSEFEPLELLFSFFFFLRYPRQFELDAFVAIFEHFLSRLLILFFFVICNISSVMNTNLFCNAIFLLFQFFVHCDYFIMNHFIHLNHSFAVMPGWRK